VKKLGKRTVTLVLLFSVGVMINNDDLLSDRLRIVLGKVFSSNSLTASFAASMLDSVDTAGDAKKNVADIYKSTFVWPVPDCKTVSEKYGRNHKGIEVACEGEKVEILAVKDGVVKKVESRVCKHEDRVDDSCDDQGRGNYVIIGHNDGIESRYEHLKYDSVVVDEGDKVKAGDVIAYMGSSGRSIKQHLYFQLNDLSKNTINVNQDKVRYIYSYNGKEDDNKDNKWKVKVKCVNLRKGPSTDDTVVAVIPKNSILDVNAEKKVANKKWLKTRYLGKVGWCSCECLSKISEKNNKKVKKNSNRGIMYYMEYKSVVIKYNIISGSIKHSQLIYHKGDTVHKYVFDTPTRKGYNFDGWYLDPNYKTPVPEEFEINENTTVYAKWTN